MNTGHTKSQITLQLVSVYDRTIEHYVERVSSYLRDSLSITYEFIDLKNYENKNEMDIVLGDIEPPSYFSLNKNIHYLDFYLFDYSSVEDIIKDINIEVYGESLVEIPDTKNIYIIKIISDFSS